MTPREARTQRRAAERKAKKAELRRQLAQGPSTHEATIFGEPSPEIYDEFPPELIAKANAERERIFRRVGRKLSPESSKTVADAPVEVCTRAEINRANSQFSTGPRTPEGKANSSQNSFKHGLYSKQLVLPGEDPAELEALRADLRAEHQPFNETEAILVNEMAEQFWRLRRMRRIEAEGFASDEKLQNWFSTGFLVLIQRTMASAERGFHKALTSLRQSQKVRGFVPSKSAEAPREEADSVSQNDPETDDRGFVPENPHQTPIEIPGLNEFVWQTPPELPAEAA